MAVSRCFGHAAAFRLLLRSDNVDVGREEGGGRPRCVMPSGGLRGAWLRAHLEKTMPDLGDAMAVGVGAIKSAGWRSLPVAVEWRRAVCGPQPCQGYRTCALCAAVSPPARVSPLAIMPFKNNSARALSCLSRHSDKD